MEAKKRAGGTGGSKEMVLALLRATGQGIYGVDLEGEIDFASRPGDTRFRVWLPGRGA